MNPFLIGLLAQGGGGLLSSLLGGLQSGQAKQRERAYRANLMRIMGPDYARQLQRSYYQQLLSSPAAESTTRGIFNAGSNITNRLQGSLAARGLSNSGVGAIAPALAGSSMAGQLGNMRTGFYNQAGDQAERQQMHELQLAQGLGPEPQYNYGTQALGRTAEGLGSYITDYYNPKKKTT